MKWQVPILIVCKAVVKDLYLFVRYTKKDLTTYRHALGAVLIDLWDEFVPKFKTTSATAHESVHSEPTDDTQMLLYLLIALPFVLCIGSAWFLFMLVFIGQ